MSDADTKARLRSAAEVLFAAKGYRGISVREITEKAGANLAAVNYHYGNKVGLVTAVLEQHVGVLNRERIRGLEALELSAEQGGAAVTLEEVLAAFFRPAVERFIGPNQALPGLLARLHQDPTPELIDAVVRLFAPVAHKFSQAIGPLCPHLSPQQILMRGIFLKGAMLHIMADGDNLAAAMTRGEVRFQDPDEVLHQLIQFCAAGYRAPA